MYVPVDAVKADLEVGVRAFELGSELKVLFLGEMSIHLAEGDIPRLIEILKWVESLDFSEGEVHEYSNSR